MPERTNYEILPGSTNRDGDIFTAALWVNGDFTTTKFLATDLSKVPVAEQNQSIAEYLSGLRNDLEEGKNANAHFVEI